MEIITLIWTVIINNNMMTVIPFIDHETGTQMEGDANIAATLNELIPECRQNSGVIYYHTASTTQPAGGDITPVSCRDWYEDQILTGQSVNF